MDRRDPEATWIQPRERLAWLWKRLEWHGHNSLCTHVSWRVRGFIALALMLVIGALFLLPTVNALMHSTLVWITTGILAAWWVYFVWQVWNYRQCKDKGVFSAIFGRHNLDERQTWSVRLWRTGLALNIVAAVTWGIPLNNSPATIAQWELAQEETWKEEAQTQRAKREGDYLRDVDARVERSRKELLEKQCARNWDNLLDLQREECEARKKQQEATRTGWYSANTVRVHTYGIWIGGVFVIAFSVCGLIWFIRLPQRREIALLRQDVKQWSKAHDRECRRAALIGQDLEQLRGAIAREGEVVVAIMMDLYLSRGATRDKLGAVAKVCRLRLRDEVLPVLIPDADTRDALLERARRARDPDELEDKPAKAASAQA